MSKLILGWQLDRRLDDRDIAATIARIKARYQPLFEDPIHHAGVWHENQGLLHFDVVQGDDPGVHLDPARIICLSGSPSITGDRARRYRAKDLYDYIHGSLGRADRGTLHHINPPFTLCWFDKRTQELGLAHDGLGADQFFVAETSHGMVFSNKCWPILHFLKEAPRIDDAAWQYWFCLGWFPGNSTPFENVRHLGRGEFIRADSRTVRFDSEDTLASWISPVKAEFPTSLMTRAMDSARQLIRLNQPTRARYGSDLTGGLDSRAICAVLIKDGIPCTFYTGGPRYSSDVVVARRIAKRFHLDWVHVKDPPFWRHEDLPHIVDAQFTKLLLWGEGLVQPARFQHFQVAPAPTTHHSYLSGGSSEISRGPYYNRVLTKDKDQGVEYRKALALFESRITTAPLSEAAAFNGTRLVREQVANGEAYGLRELDLLDFLYLTEKMRRWQAAHRAINLFDSSVVPFFNIEHIKLGFAMRPLDKAERRFQSFVIAQNAAELLHLAFGNSFRFKLQERLVRVMSRSQWLGGMLKTLGWAEYLRVDGKSEIEEIFASDTPLWGILEKGKAAAKWRAFLRGSDQNLQFPLGLMAFQRWYAMYGRSDG